MNGLVGEQEGFVVDTELNWEPAKVEEVPTELGCGQVLDILEPDPGFAGFPQTGLNCSSPFGRL